MPAKKRAKPDYKFDDGVKRVLIKCSCGVEANLVKGCPVMCRCGKRLDPGKSEGTRVKIACPHCKQNVAIVLTRS